MAKCPKCNAELADDAKFCTACGEKIEAAYKSHNKTNSSCNINAFFQNFNNTSDFTIDMDAQDINENKLMAILAYIGWLVFIPILAVPNSKFARFHANQGLLLLILLVVSAILGGIFSILSLIVSWVLPILGFIVSSVSAIVMSVIFIILLYFFIFGVVNAAAGKAKELPIVGLHRIIK